jgi:hypothetical protein
MRQSSVEFIKAIKSTSANRTVDEKEDGIVFATDAIKKRPTRKKSSNDTVHFLRIRIGKLVAEKAGLKAGDKVELEWDKESRLGFIVQNPEGWVLNGLKRLKAGEKENGYQPLQLRYTWYRGLPSIHEPKLCREVVVIKGDLGDTTTQFVFPEGTSFDRLAEQPKIQEGDPSGNIFQYNRRATDKIATDKRANG